MLSFTEYNKLNPNGLISDYIKYTEECADLQLAAELEQQAKCKAFYDNLIGKYYCFRFNPKYFLYVHLDKSIRIATNRFTVYKVSFTNGFSLSKEEKMPLKYTWIKNEFSPYPTEDVGVEISKEDFDKVLEKFAIVEKLAYSF